MGTIISTPTQRILCFGNGANESDEGNESGQQWCHDRNAGLRFRRRDVRTEVQGREGRRRGYRHRRGGTIEEERFVQARWCVEPEAQEKAGPPCSQGCES